MLSKLYRFQRDMDMYFSSTTTFIIKCFVLSLFYPRYEFLDSKCRADKLTGKIEHYSDRSWDQGWK